MPISTLCHDTDDGYCGCLAIEVYLKDIIDAPEYTIYVYLNEIMTA